MTLRRTSLAPAFTLACGGLLACSVIVGTDGLSEGAATLPDASLDSPATPDVDVIDAPNETTVPIDAATADGDGSPASIAAAYVAAVLSDAPIAYLRLEETQGTATAKNEVAGPGGSYTSGMQLGVEGAFAGSTGVLLDGTVGGISLGSSRPFAGTAPFAMELWFRPTANDASFRFLVSAYESVDAGRESFGLYTNTTYGLVAERYVASVSQSTTGVPVLAPGAYHHCVIDYDGTTLSLYIDGALARTVPDMRASLATAPELVFGAFGAGGLSVVGTIDELAVYDKVLAAPRILAHYKASGR